MAKEDYAQKIDDFIDSLTKISSMMGGLTSKEEQTQMEGKKAVFVIKGIKKRYILQVFAGRILSSDNLSNTDTYCYANSAEKFYDYANRLIYGGDVSAFERANQRGDFVMKGKHSLHDRIMWKKAFDRVARAMEVYSGR